MSTLHEQNGAQLLPRVGAQAATMSSWIAETCISADHRTKYAEYRVTAARLVVRGGAS